MMTDDEIRQIVREAVYETLSGLGMAAHEQHEVQADFLYIRRMRKGSEAISGSIKTTLITVLIPSFLYVIWEALKSELWK
jgi:hypothetical protein